MQTPAASKASPVSKELCDDLQSSFAPRHEAGAEGGASFLRRDEKKGDVVNTRSAERNRDPARPSTGSRSRRDGGLTGKGGRESEGLGGVADASGRKASGEAPGGTAVEDASSMKPHATKDDKMTASRERGSGSMGSSRKRRGTRAPGNQKGEGSMGMTYQVRSPHEMSSGASSVSHASGTKASFDAKNERKQGGRAEVDEVDEVDTKSHRKKRRRR